MNCLDSLARQENLRCPIFVLDNASDEDPTPLIYEAMSRANVIRATTNIGFAAGMNLGMAKALEKGADLVLCLNDDVILLPGCLEALIQASVDRPRAGILCPWIYHPDPEKTLYSAGVTVDRWATTRHLLSGQRAPSRLPQPYECQAVTGCAIVISKELFRETGGFDARFFLYYEETDLCAKALESGFQIWVVPQAGIIHLTTPQEQANLPHVTYFMWRNRLLYLKNRRRSPLIALVLLATEALPRSISWSIKPRWRDKRFLIPHMFRGIWDGIRGVEGPFRG